MYFVTGLCYDLEQPPTAGLAKTKADIAKKSSFSARPVVSAYHVNYWGVPYDKHVLGHIQRAEELRGTISKYSQDTRPSFLPWSPCQKLVRVALLPSSMYLWLGRSRQ